MNKTYIAVDIGTTHIKAVCFDQNGRITALHKTENSLDEHGAYQAQDVYTKAAKVIRACNVQNPSAVCLTGMADSGLLVDSEGAPLTQVLPWSDVTGYEKREELLGAYSLSGLYHITGQTLHPKFALMRLLHYRTAEPAAFEGAACWLSLQDYILFCLTGEMKTDESLASRTMLYDIGARAWHEGLSAFCGIGNRLPEVVETGSEAGKIHVVGACATGLDRGLPVYVCGHDHPCALYGISELLGSHMIDSMGTSEVFAGILEERLRDDAAKLGINHGLMMGGKYYWLANLPSSGASLKWLKSLSGQKEYDFFTKNQAKDGGGVTYYPFINGSGVPDPDPNRRGAFLGLSSQTTIHQMAYAMYEGIAFEARRIFDAYLSLTGHRLSEITCVGGSTQNETMIQVRADIAGIRMDVLNVSELTALGAVLMAVHRQGGELAAEAHCQSIAPNEEWAGKIQARYNAYKEVCGILYANKC